MKTWATPPRLGSPAAVLLVLFLLAAPGAARAHAYLKRADPAVGSTLAASPSQVRIWFDAELEPAFSTIAVRGAGGVVGDERARVDSRDPKLLAMSVPPLARGTYEVTWSVVTRDGHRTSGNYHFTIR